MGVGSGSIWAVYGACAACVACGATDDGHDPDSSSAGTAGSAAAAGAPIPGSASAGAASSGGAVSSTGGQPHAGSSGGEQSAGRGGGGTSHGGAPATGGAATGGTGGGSGIDDYAGPGTVTSTWDGFCVATFTTAYEIKDAFQKSLFTAQPGERYLMLRYDEIGVDLAYLTPAGQIAVGVAASAPSVYPFTSSCQQDPPHSYFAVFADVKVYAEPTLSSEICSISAGTAVLRDTSKNAGSVYETTRGDVTIHEVFLNAFGERCGGAETGYVGVTPIHALGSDRNLVPFGMIAAEK